MIDSVAHALPSVVTVSRTWYVTLLHPDLAPVTVNVYVPATGVAHEIVYSVPVWFPYMPAGIPKAENTTPGLAVKLVDQLVPTTADWSSVDPGGGTGLGTSSGTTCKSHPTAEHAAWHAANVANGPEAPAGAARAGAQFPLVQ